jgi:leucyl/phenylalanyl-tRNA--protein transferase
VLLDAQFHNPHLEQFGLIEIPRADFKQLLKEALKIDARFYSNSVSSSSARGASFTGSGAAQRITQIS